MFRNIKQKNKKACPSKLERRRGFSLIEMLVSVAIFSVVMIISVGSLMSIVEANRKARSFQMIMNNLNFAVEDMVRTIRLGTSYHCGSSGDIESPRDCWGGDSEITVEPTGGNPNTSNDQVTYRLNNGVIEKIQTSGGFLYSPITSDEIVVENLSFYVIGSDISDKEQPKVLIVVSGYAKESDKSLSTFNIQTTVTQRILDF